MQTQQYNLAPELSEERINFIITKINERKPKEGTTCPQCKNIVEAKRNHNNAHFRRRPCCVTKGKVTVCGKCGCCFTQCPCHTIKNKR